MKKTAIVSVALIMVMVLCLGIVTYASADSFVPSYPTTNGTFNNTSISSSGFTGTQLRSRTSLSIDAGLYSNATKPYLTWQSQWKNVATGNRYNGFTTWGVITGGIEVTKSYRSPYNNRYEPYLVKINNSDTSSTNLTGYWHP